MFRFFVSEACDILAPQPGIEPAPPALEGEVVITGPPGRSHHGPLFKVSIPAPSLDPPLPNQWYHLPHTL